MEPRRIERRLMEGGTWKQSKLLLIKVSRIIEKTYTTSMDPRPSNKAMNTSTVADIYALW
jgi:hypothetical protein